MVLKTRFHRYSKRVTATKRWQVLRMEILERDGFRCKSCGARGRLEVDHIKSVRTNPELSFDPDNLQALCPSCHTTKTNIERGRPPPREDRLKWREAVEELSHPDERGIMQKEIKDA